MIRAQLTAILDAIFNFSKRSMMPEWHQLDSSCTMSEQQESMKKKTLKSSSRSFMFSTGLWAMNGVWAPICPVYKEEVHKAAACTLDQKHHYM